MTVRDISLDGMREMFAEESDHVLMVLLEVSHTSITTQYFVSNNENVAYGGNEYTAAAFETTFATDDGETIYGASLKISNISRALVESVRSVSSPPSVVINLIRMAPNGDIAVEVGPLNFSILGVSIDVDVIEAALGYEEDYLNAAASKDTFDYTLAPGLF